MSAEQFEQTRKKVRSAFCAAHDHVAVLPAREIVRRDVGARENERVVEDGELGVVHTEHLTQKRASRAREHRVSRSGEAPRVPLRRRRDERDGGVRRRAQARCEQREGASPRVLPRASPPVDQHARLAHSPLRSVCKRLGELTLCFAVAEVERRDQHSLLRTRHALHQCLLELEGRTQHGDARWRQLEARQAMCGEPTEDVVDIPSQNWRCCTLIRIRMKPAFKDVFMAYG
mmetsp:Transcript_40719/g.95098  ORF Transcript_40719/g.95098 Transcript_40719/m.95098 type:complete len:231 (+) Transcript_40719:334-1026(+)